MKRRHNVDVKKYRNQSINGPYIPLLIMKKPKLLKNKDIDIQKLKDICEQYLIEVEEGRSIDSDTPHYIYEIAMLTFYGKDVFDYIGNIKLNKEEPFFDETNEEQDKW